MTQSAPIFSSISLMDCRSGCGACCIAPSISSPIPGMPVINGISKRAGQRCLHLTLENQCGLFNDPRRPAVCASLMPRLDMCGDSREFALNYLNRLELATSPWVSQSCSAGPRSRK